MFIQKRLECKQIDERQLLWKTVFEAASKKEIFGIMSDSFGNYVVQLMLDFGEVEERRQIKDLVLD